MSLEGVVHFVVAFIVTSDNVFVFELRQAEYVTAGLLVVAAFATATLAPARATAPAITPSRFQ
jgi:hypothetical protein